MDVNYNTRSGMSIPLADIVESGNDYVKFANGLILFYIHNLHNIASSISSLYDSATRTVRFTVDLPKRYPYNIMTEIFDVETNIYGFNKNGSFWGPALLSVGPWVRAWQTESIIYTFSLGSYSSEFSASDTYTLTSGGTFIVGKWK